eukprot:767970-Hanusia_phi.AAC.3
MSKHVKSAWIMERSFLALNNIFQNQNNIAIFVSHGLISLVQKVLLSHSQRSDVIAVGFDVLKTLFENELSSKKIFLESKGLDFIFRVLSRDMGEPKIIPRVVSLLSSLIDEICISNCEEIAKLSKAFGILLEVSKDDEELLYSTARLLHRTHQLHPDLYFGFQDDASSLFTKLYRSSAAGKDKLQHLMLISAVLNISTSSIVSSEVHALLQEAAQEEGQLGVLARCCLSMACVQDFLANSQKSLKDKTFAGEDLTARSTENLSCLLFAGMNSFDLLARLTMEEEEEEEEEQEDEGEEEEEEEEEFKTMPVKEEEVDGNSQENKYDQVIDINQEVSESSEKDSSAHGRTEDYLQENDEGQVVLDLEGPLVPQEDENSARSGRREGEPSHSEWIEVQLDDLFQSPQDFSYAYCSYDVGDHSLMQQRELEETGSYTEGGDVQNVRRASYPSQLPPLGESRQNALPSFQTEGTRTEESPTSMQGDSRQNKKSLALTLEKLIYKFQLKNLRLESQRRGRKGRHKQETEKAKKLRILRQVTDFLFRVERAHWEYIDQDCKNNPGLPALRFAAFAKHVFHRIPMLAPLAKMEDIGTLLKHFSRVKAGTRSCGAVVLNPSCTKCVLVRGFKSPAFGWPKGKVEHWESDASCAIREVREEIGLDITSLLNETNSISLKLQHKDPNGITTRSVLRLFIVYPVPEDTPLCTNTNNEISEIRWFEIDDLPTGSSLVGKNADNSFWLVPPIVKSLRHWLRVKLPRAG